MTSILHYNNVELIEQVHDYNLAKGKQSSRVSAAILNHYLH